MWGENSAVVKRINVFFSGFIAVQFLRRKNKYEIEIVMFAGPTFDKRLEGSAQFSDIVVVVVDTNATLSRCNW